MDTADYDIEALNFKRAFEFNIMKNSAYKRGKSIIYLDQPMYVNDIFKIKFDHNIRYYIKTFLKMEENSYAFEIKRFDKSPITQLDLDRLVKGKKIIVKGTYK